METNTPVTREAWEQALAFNNRFDADLKAMNAKDTDVPSNLHECANEIINLAGDVVCNGGRLSDWNATPESIQGKRAALRLIMAAAAELNMFLDTLEEADIQSE